MTSEKEAVSADARPLDKAAVKRLSTLLNEITDMHVGLGRLLDTDHDDCHTALRELHKAMDCRLAETCNLIWAGEEEPENGPALVELQGKVS